MIGFEDDNDEDSYDEALYLLGSDVILIRENKFIRNALMPPEAV